MKLGKVPNNLTPYDDNYKEICFVAWYKNGRPNGEKFLEAIPVDKDGRKPHLVQLNEWRSFQNWDLRADVMDTEVARQIEKRAIEEKVEMFTRHAALGKDLQNRGMEFFDSHGIEKDSTALKMIISGVEMEKVSRGLPDALMAISEMQDDDLKGLVGKLLQHFDPNDTNLDVNDLEKISSKIIEGTFKDMPEDAEQ